MPTSRPARTRLLEAATQLFSVQGINATGIDQVIEHADVAKASLYNNFSGKDDLVRAYLERQLDNFETLLRQLEASSEGATRVDRLFQCLSEAAAKRSFQGCPFSKAAVEVAPQSAPGRTIKRFYARLEAFFARALNLERGDERLRQLVVLYDGAMTSAKVQRDPKCVDAALSLARDVAHARRPTP
ncbi:MAG TPA: TetR/AcrR family transcriptional regulator [Acidimicrobiales bacterium]|nr:TetR/AcrR family transcriptional regulator [Acidimicrobiales bacterium]